MSRASRRSRLASCHAAGRGACHIAVVLPLMALATATPVRAGQWETTYEYDGASNWSTSWPNASGGPFAWPTGLGTFSWIGSACTCHSSGRIRATLTWHRGSPDDKPTPSTYVVQRAMAL